MDGSDASEYLFVRDKHHKDHIHSKQYKMISGGSSDRIIPEMAILY